MQLILREKEKLFLFSDGSFEEIGQFSQVPKDQLFTYCNQDIYYVPLDFPMCIRSIKREEFVLSFDSNCTGIGSFRNNVVLTTTSSIYFVDTLSSKSTCFPVGCTISSMGANGKGLFVTDGDGVFSFDCELHTLMALTTASGPKTITAFGTLQINSPNGVVEQPLGDNISQTKMAPVIEFGKLYSGSSVLYENVDFTRFETVKPCSDSESADDCAVCLCALEDEDSITLFCGHMFHVECLQQCLLRSEEYVSKATHINFSASRCPQGCGALVTHPIAPNAAHIVALRRAIVSMAADDVKRLNDDTKCPDDLLYYVCGTCSEPFFGGLRICPRMMNGEPSKTPSDLKCERCFLQECDNTGSSFARKCRFCCNVSTIQCFGCYFLCDDCDRRWTSAIPDTLPCNNPGHCVFCGNHDAESV